MKNCNFSMKNCNFHWKIDRPMEITTAPPLFSDLQYSHKKTETKTWTACHKQCFWLKQQPNGGGTLMCVCSWAQKKGYGIKKIINNVIKWVLVDPNSIKMVSPGLFPTRKPCFRRAFGSKTSLFIDFWWFSEIFEKK